MLNMARKQPEAVICENFTRLLLNYRAIIPLVNPKLM